MVYLQPLRHPSPTAQAAMDTPCPSPAESNTAPHTNSSARAMPRCCAGAAGQLMTYSEAHTSPRQQWADADILEA